MGMHRHQSLILGKPHERNPEPHSRQRRRPWHSDILGNAHFQWEHVPLGICFRRIDRN